MAKLIMCRGIPGSGKSYWAATQTDAIIVTRDDIREAYGCVGGGWSKAKEFYVVHEMTRRIMEGLKEGKTVISADTNLRPFHEMKMRDLADKCGAEFEIKEFDTPLETCIYRDNQRTGHRHVGDKKIVEYYKELEKTRSQK